MSKIDNFPYTPLLKFGVVSFGVDPSCLGSAESEKVRLIGREIIFAEFQPMWQRYLNVTDGRTDRVTYGQLVGAYARGPAFCWVHCQHV